MKVNSHRRSKVPIGNSNNTSVSEARKLDKSAVTATEVNTSMESSNQQDEVAVPNDEPLDLSMKRKADIDLDNGVLDLSMKKHSFS